MEHFFQKMNEFSLETKKKKKNKTKKENNKKLKTKKMNNRGWTLLGLAFH
jgi:hypothetical protein